MPPAATQPLRMQFRAPLPLIKVLPLLIMRVLRDPWPWLRAPTILPKLCPAVGHLAALAAIMVRVQREPLAQMASPALPLLPAKPLPAFLAILKVLPSRD